MQINQAQINRVQINQAQIDQAQSSEVQGESMAARTSRRFAAAAVALGLSAAVLAACSDSTSEDPLPLTDDDSGVIVEDPPADEPLVDDAPLEEAPVDGDDQMEDGG